MMRTYDVVIVGGGMVGLTLACGLHRSGLRIAVLEQSESPSEGNLPEAPSIRVSAIHAASEHLLRELEVWDRITALRATPYQAMSVWDQDSFGRIEFQASEHGYAHLGHIIENSVIQRALAEKVDTLADVDCLTGAELQTIAWGESEAFLTLRNGQMLSARLVVGADGAHSWLRQHADIPLTFREYGHHALVATVRTTLPHEQTAWQSFHDEGILAFLPLWQDNLCSIVWSLPPEKAEQMKTCTEETFNRSLALALDMRLGLCAVESERLTIPLVARYARNFAGHRLALMGDAAHTIHPLAGQGVNLGLMDVAELMGELRRLHREGKDIGEHLHLRRYERRRKFSAAKMLATMQGFRSLFAGHDPLKKLIRGVGLRAASELPSVKHQLVQQAMGWGDLPETLADNLPH